MKPGKSERKSDRPAEKAKEKTKKLSPIQEMSNEEVSSPEAEAPTPSPIIRRRRLDSFGARPGSIGRVGAPGLTRISKAPGNSNSDSDNGSNSNNGNGGGRHGDNVGRGRIAGTSSMAGPLDDPRAILPAASAGASAGGAAAATIPQPDRQQQLQQQLQQQQKKKQQQQAQPHDRNGGLGKRVSNPPKRLLSPVLGPTGDDSSHSDEDSIRSPSIPPVPPSGRATGTDATGVLGNISSSSNIAAAQGDGRAFGRGAGEGRGRTGRDCVKGSRGRRRSASCPSTGNRTISGGDRSIRSGVDVGPAQATNETEEPMAAVPCQVHFDIPVELPSHAVVGRPLQMQVPLEFELPPGARPGMTVTVRVAALLAPNTPTPLVLTGEVLPLPRDTEPEFEQPLGDIVGDGNSDVDAPAIIETPGPYDIVVGKGNRADRYPGGRFLLKVIHLLQPSYNAIQDHRRNGDTNKVPLVLNLVSVVMDRKGGCVLEKKGDHFVLAKNDRETLYQFIGKQIRKKN